MVFQYEFRFQEFWAAVGISRDRRVYRIDRRRLIPFFVQCLMLVWVISVPIAAGQGLAPDVLKLVRVKQQNAAALGAASDFACLLMCSRFEQAKAMGALRKLDTLRLDVTWAGGREMYSWPDQTAFDDGSAADIVRSGLIGDGQFAGFVRNLFLRR